MAWESALGEGSREILLVDSVLEVLTDENRQIIVAVYTSRWLARAVARNHFGVLPINGVRDRIRFTRSSMLRGSWDESALVTVKQQHARKMARARVWTRWVNDVLAM